ncbi:reticulon-4-like [Condylostylus longicornis]|uniref:reticulon-4-like n=1 Tax=Condylostylus longicornis TaxID=2530218 RepID=UPI00244E3AED|nr:reticulon-4-like [Condylostylus longicornis]XP_055377969.1 reticulon-4-like [Condylostylus longicornis]
MDQNMDFGINLAQESMSSAQKHEKFQPGYGSDLRNATQNFLAAELGGGGYQIPKNEPERSMHNLDNAEEFQFDMKSAQNNPFSDQHADDEFEHDSLNFSPATPKLTTNENENVKFISSTDLLDDFDKTKSNILKPEEAAQKINQLVNDGKNEIIANLGSPVNLEFKVEPDNVKLISSETLLDDFETNQTGKPTVTERQVKFNDFTSKDFDMPKESQTTKLEFNIAPTENTSSSWSDDLIFSKPTVQMPMPTAPEPKQFSDFEDDFLKDISAPKTKSNVEFDNDKFVSAENIGFDAFLKTNKEDIKVPKAISDTIENIKESVSDITKPSSSTSAISSKVKTELPKTNIMQGEVIFHKPNAPGKSNFNIHPLIESIIYWRDVKVSGIVFAIGLIILLALTCFSVISVIAYTSLIALAGTVGFRIYNFVLGMLNDKQEGHPFEEYLQSDIDISQERAKQVCGVTVANVNAFVTELKKLFLVEDYVESVKFGIILWFLTYIGSWFNGMTLIILGYILLFTLPIAYEQNKQIIDQNIELVRVKISEISDKIHAAIPFGKNTTGESHKNK